MVNGHPDISKGVLGGYNASNHCVKRHNIQSESHGENQMGIQRGNEEMNAPQKTKWK
jgi:hypothetical protein